MPLYVRKKYMWEFLNLFIRVCINPCLLRYCSKLIKMPRSFVRLPAIVGISTFLTFNKAGELQLNRSFHVCTLRYFLFFIMFLNLVCENERGYRLTAKNKRFWSLQILLLSVVSIRRKLLKTTHTEESSVHSNSESCNIQLGS